MRSEPMLKYTKCYLYLAVVHLLFITHIYAGNVTPNPILLYSTEKDIRILNTTKHKLKANTVVQNVSKGMLSFDYERKKLCWTDQQNGTIQCGDFDGSDVSNVEVIVNDILNPQGLACDWYTNKLYWTDNEKDQIEVTMIVKPYHRKVLYWTDIDQPRAIVVMPSKGLLFWTDWGEVPKIERAGMDGNPNSRKVIANDEIYWPNGLTIDYETDTIYWTDGHLVKVERINIDGTNRTVLKSGLRYPYAITNFYHKLYWTDWKLSAIMTMANNKNETRELLKSDPYPTDIHVWSAEIQVRQKTPCDDNNGGCTHLCLLSPTPPGYSCACPIGIKPTGNTTCADGPEQILVLARRTNICIVYLDSPEYTYKTLNLTNMNYIIGVDYDPVQNQIYWTDDEISKIQKAGLDGSNQKDVISDEIVHPDGVAVDWVARNLYWADPGMDRIEVTTLSGEYRKIIISNDLYEPRAIAVSPELGWMFWSDWSEKKPKIERANLDGTERRIIVATKLLWPNGIALDVEKRRLYWCDARVHKIEYIGMDGTNRIVLLDADLPHPFGFTIMGNYLYWTDWHGRSIDRVHKDTGTFRETIVDQVSDVMGLKAIQLGNISGYNPCADNNGNCSHFCLYRHDKTYVCACPIEYDLTKDNKTCYVPEEYFFFSANGSIGRANIDLGTEISLPMKNVKSASSIDFDYANNRIYWTDSRQKTVMRAYTNGSDPQKVVELGLIFPSGIAVDWVALNVYWSDASSHRIEVARLSGTSRRVLLWRNVDEPYSIALDPQRGFMYWAEWGSSKRIRRAGMDGSDVRNLIDEVGNVMGLVIDYKVRRLFWTETSAAVIMSSDFDGQNQRKIYASFSGKPQGLAIFDSYIYWGNASNGEIWRMAKDNWKTQHGVTSIAKLTETATELAVFSNSYQKHKVLNNCGVNNGGCSHLCLAMPSKNEIESVSYTCACPTHFTKANQTCLPPKKFMIYSQKNLAVRLLPDSTDCSEAVLPIHGLKTVKSIDFDPIDNYLYWIESKTLQIKRVNVSGIQPPTIIVTTDPKIKPFDLAIDSLGRLLFWTCTAKDVINITRLNDSSVVGVIQKRGDRPRLIVLHATKRLVFYTNVTDTTSLIRARMDGSQGMVIKDRIDGISAIAVDIENDLLLWVEDRKIYMANIDGENQHVLLGEPKSKVIALTVHLGWLYWLDRDINQLQRIELRTGESRSPVLNHASHIVDLISVTQPDTSHFCASPKRCSHLCIMNGTQPICGCPSSLSLKKDDRRTCVELPTCTKDHFTCANTDGTNGCIPITWRCDKIPDCNDGSDEVDCPVCKPDEYKCKNLVCISSKRVCDGNFDCKDGSDEESCCKINQYQCPDTNVCIPSSSVCDGVDHCADGADESKSACLEASKYIQTGKSNSNVMIIGIVSIVIIVVLLVATLYFLQRKCRVNETPLDQSEDLLNPDHQHPHNKGPKIRRTMPDVIGLSVVHSQISSYDRNNITGASSSTNVSSIGCYPRETLNPPPSPATTGSTRTSTRYRPYRHYRVINQPPPPTPCSTDVCDESDYNYSCNNYSVERRYDREPSPPPPTPRSHYYSESGPPSPGSRSSTYFSPFPPPPSPAASPIRGYDS